ncbi:MAG TPA: DinB family protein [Candidatus Krumholzibacteria bacterium]|nr:DinB family protein [Candidatus Krumholzibacteria bacterium]
MSAPDASAFARRLAASGEALVALVADVDRDEAVWRPAAGRWSILEIVGHLVDEERHDFRQRLRLLLADPARVWPPIDPEGLVRSSNFNARELNDLAGEFVAEREQSVEWLASLVTPDWEHACTHPTAGVLTAAGLLHAWAAHDLLHLRQLTAVRFARLQSLAAPAALDYAGTW